MPIFSTSSTSAPGVTKLSTAGSASTQGATDPRHMPVSTVSTAGDARARLAYAVQSQPALDNNTVDLDRERANFTDNSNLARTQAAREQSNSRHLSLDFVQRLRSGQN